MLPGSFKAAAIVVVCVAGIPAAGIAIKESFFSSGVTVPENLSEISTKLQPKPRKSQSPATTPIQTKDS